MSARYLLRFDDLSPTVSAGRWSPLAALVAEFHLRPILAVIPDNHDPELEASPPDADFWNQMRSLEAAGATIGLHGYRHLCQSHGRGLVDLHRVTEFAGVEFATQRAWIAAGLRLLRGHGLNPRIWVAPRHGFDARTLAALRVEGLSLLSDGFARRPFIRRDLTWIPQQLWGPVDKPNGLWTICLHPNSTGDDQLAALRAFLVLHANQFLSVDEALLQFPPAPLPLAERLYAGMVFRRLKCARLYKAIRRRVRLRSSNSP
jgi:predicted deacetylase